MLRAMTALRVIRTGMVGVVLTVLMVGNGTADAQTAPTLKTDASSYDRGAPVTYIGTGWAGCDTITVTMFTRGGPSVVASGISPANGSFSGSFVPLPVPDGAGLGATSAQGRCSAQTDFFIGPVITGNGPSSSSAAAAGQLANTGVNAPLLLIGAGIAVAVGSAFVVAGRRPAS
jgi:hypothetical protein